LSVRHTPRSQKLFAPHCESVEQSGWQNEFTQRNAVPQSASNTHCEVAGLVIFAHRPPTQALPTPQVVSFSHWRVQEPFTQERPAPQFASTLQSASCVVPQTGDGLV
jgi:hypothetical protein